MKDNFKKNFPNLDLPPNLGSICLMRRESGQLALPFRGDLVYCHQKNSKKSSVHNASLITSQNVTAPKPRLGFVRLQIGLITSQNVTAPKLIGIVE